MEDAFIALRGLGRCFKVGKVDVPAITGVTLDISRGGFTALVGPSGSGKSTLLNLIGGLDHPDAGEICVNQLTLNQASEQQLEQYRRTQIGFIFQSFHLIPSLSAVENIEVPMMLAETSRSERRTRALGLLESVGLAQRAHHKPNELSGGEKQRVAIARALANRPPILLADEPTGNLDSKNGAAILDMLCELLKTNGLTLIMVTHDPEIASRAQQIVHVKDGRIENIKKGGSL
jgi:ABC-type lipoprotein export system ATPase subunit